MRRGRTVLLAAALMAAVIAAGAVALWRAAPGAAPVPSPSLARQAQDRAAALDRQARAATQASERASAAAAALAVRVQAAEHAVAAVNVELRALQSRKTGIAQRLARETRPNAWLVAGLASQARQPPLLALLQPGSLTQAVRLRATMVAVAPQIAARTQAVRGALRETQELERASARLAAQRTVRARALARENETLATMAAAERLKAQRAAGSADREAERALVLSASGSAVTQFADRLTAGGAPAIAAPRRAQESIPREYRLPATGQVTIGASGGLALRPVPNALLVAPAAGQVAFSGPYRGYGTILIIEHDGGAVSLLTGLGSSAVAIGQTLAPGAPIGRAAPNDTPIEWELRRAGQRIDLSGLAR